MSLSTGPAGTGGGGVSLTAVSSVLGASRGGSGEDSPREEVPGAGGAAAAVAEELEDPLVKKGREAQADPVLTPLPVGSGPSLKPLGFDQWLRQLSGGRAVSTVLQNLLGAE